MSRDWTNHETNLLEDQDRSSGGRVSVLRMDRAVDPFPAVPGPGKLETLVSAMWSTSR